MNSFKLVTVGFLVVLFQTTLVKLFEFYQIGPDLTLIFIVWCALQFGPVAGLFSGFLIGALFDVYSYIDFLGVGMLVKGTLGYVIGLADDHVIQLEWSTKVMILGVAFFIHDMAYHLLTGLSSDVLGDNLLHVTLPEAIYTLIIASIVFNLYTPKSNES